MRAVLALWVLVYHLAIWQWLTSTGASRELVGFAGWTSRYFQEHGETHPAVVVFIVLSGYCIHRNGCRGDAWSVRTYVVKRALRIWPVYAAASLVGAVLYVVARHNDVQVANALGQTTGITAGCMAVKLSGVAALVPHLYRCTLQGNPPLVTVMVEIWLYAVYAFAAVTLLRRFGDRALWFAVIVIYGGVLLWVAPQQVRWEWWHNGSAAAFLPYWWIGAAAVGSRRTPRWDLVAAAGAAIWVATLFVDGISLPVAELHKLGLALVAAWVIGGIDAPAFRLPAPATLLGRSGYSLYAFHAPVLIVALTASIRWPIVLVIAIAGGIVAYVVYERPLMLYGRTLADRASRSVTVGPAPAR